MITGMYTPSQEKAEVYTTMIYDHLGLKRGKCLVRSLRHHSCKGEVEVNKFLNFLEKVGNMVIEALKYVLSAFHPSPYTMYSVPYSR